MKVILNKCYGGFGVSVEGYELYCKKKGATANWYERIGNKLVKSEDPNHMFVYCFIKDIGNNVEYSKDTFDKYHIYLDDEHREDPVLIEVVEELGENANGRYSELVVVDIPDGLDYVIDEYDGIETLHERVKCW